MTGAATYRGVLPSRSGAHPPSVDLSRKAEELAIAALGSSLHSARFSLHGAWAVGAWTGGLPRPTHGIDLLDRGQGSVENVVAALHAGLSQSPGGLLLNWCGVRVRTKARRRSPLHRISIPARLGCRQLDLRVDVMVAPTDHSGIEFRPLHSVAAGARPIWAPCCGVDDLVAEKAALLVTYGASHTRLQDVFDLRLLSEQIRFDRSSLTKAMASNFEGRDAARMLDRDDGYWEGAFDPHRVSHGEETRWADLLAMAGQPAPPGNLAVTLTDLGRFLVPVLQAMRQGSEVRAGWEPGIGWSAEMSRWPRQNRRCDAVARSDFWEDAIMMTGSSRK